MLSPMTINALVDLVTGDSPLTPRQTGPQMIAWFNPFGFEDNYSNGLPPDNTTRKLYAKKRIERINEEFDIKSFIESIVDSRRFINSPELQINLAAEMINRIIANDGLVLKNVLGAYKLFNLESEQEVGVIAAFDNIHQVILQEINQAEFMIWVAVAWFTDRTIFAALEKKKKSGVDVRLIIIDDEINRNSGFSHGQWSDVRMVEPKGKYGNMMHHKFAIFDLKKVIHGSYNWTNRAKYNNESISVTQGRAFAEQFSRQFVDLFAEN